VVWFPLLLEGPQRPLRAALRRVGDVSAPRAVHRPQHRLVERLGARATGELPRDVQLPPFDLRTEGGDPVRLHDRGEIVEVEARGTVATDVVLDLVDDAPRIAGAI